MSVSLFRMNEAGNIDTNGFWNLVIVFQNRAFFKYLPDAFGKLRVLKRVAVNP